jgi:hypothetical protein
VPCRDAGRLVFSVGDALADSLVRTGGVVVLLIPGQDGEQMCGAEYQHPIQEFTAPRADEPLAGRVHLRSLDGGAQDRGSGGPEDGLEGGGEVGAAVVAQEPEVPEPVVEVQRQVADLLEGLFPSALHNAICPASLAGPRRIGLLANQRQWRQVGSASVIREAVRAVITGEIVAPSDAAEGAICSSIRAVSSAARWVMSSTRSSIIRHGEAAHCCVN